jgi:hypothetical protein
MKINKSQAARDFWRYVIDHNTIDLSSDDARKKAVTDFLDNADNKKKGWKKADRRFFRLAFDKIMKEKKISPHQFGIKPEPKRVNTAAGKMNINIKTNEKPVHELYQKDEKENDEIKQNAVPNSEQLQRQQQEIAATYTAQSVGGIFAMIFNIFHSRFPECTPLNVSEQTALGDAWYPIFNEYLGDKGGKWILPIVITAPIVLVRFSQYTRAKQERDLTEQYMNDAPKDATPPKDDDKKNDKNWSNRL